jgi:hypothetical protein
VERVRGAPVLNDTLNLKSNNKIKPLYQLVHYHQNRRETPRIAIKEKTLCMQEYKPDPKTVIEVHFLLHPEEEQLIAARVYTSLKDAFDARVVGKKLANVLSKAV